MSENWLLCSLLLIASMVSGQESSAPTSGKVADQLSGALTQAAESTRTRLDFDGKTFSGPAWDRLLAEGRDAQFFLLGEEHGIAENPKLAAALYTALHKSGYERLAIEISPTMARKLDQRLYQEGINGLRRLFDEPGGEPAFFGMKEEAEMLASIRATSEDAQPIFWGVDYEVLGDRQLIKALENMPEAGAAKTELTDLRSASAASWEQHASTGNIALTFSFGGDPALVRAVRDAWPETNPEGMRILHTLEETLEINQLFVSGQNWLSNARRATLIRDNFLHHWRTEAITGRTPKVMAKMGASHLVQGRSNTEAFDLGALIPELAAINGGHAFRLLVLPGEGSVTAVFDPVKLTFNPAPAKDGYAEDLQPLISAAHNDAFTLIDLRPLRATRGLTRATTNRNLLRVIMGYDMVLVMSGSTASAALRQ